MIPVPEITDAEMAFGTIKHLPKRESLPEEYQRDWHSDRLVYCRAVSGWFYKGARRLPDGIEVDGRKFVARPGVDSEKALRAISATLKSWDCKHEHKIGGCGWLLSQWFELKETAGV